MRIGTGRVRWRFSASIRPNRKRMKGVISKGLVPRCFSIASSVVSVNCT
jgi:hypothetical protein